MKDYFGNILQIGDEVAYIQGGYREFRTGIITAFTAKMVKVKCTVNTDETIRASNVLIKKISDEPRIAQS